MIGNQDEIRLRPRSNSIDGARGAIIDKGIEDWASVRRECLENAYGLIFQVGAKGFQLDERAKDDEIAAYCRDNGCDLFTPDTTFYKGFFAAKVKTVRLTSYDWWKKRYIFKIEIDAQSI